MGRQDPYDALHEGLSELIQVTAQYPPKDDDSKYNLLKFVKIIPDVSRREMIRPLCVDIRKFVTPYEKKELEKKMSGKGKPLPDKMLSSTSKWSTHGSLALRALGEPSVSATHASSRSSVRDLKVTSVKRRALTQGGEEYLQKLVNKYFHKFILNRNFHEAVRQRFMIAVITSVVTGELKVFSTRVRSKSKKLKAGIDDVGAGMEYTTANSTAISSGGSGIIGLGLMCFLVECDPNKCRYTLARGVRVVPGKDDLFPQYCDFISIERRMFGLLGASKLKEMLFAGSTTIHENRGDLDSKSRRKFREITNELGKRPSAFRVTKQIAQDSGLGHIIKGVNILIRYLRGDNVHPRRHLIASS